MTFRSWFSCDVRGWKRTPASLAIALTIALTLAAVVTAQSSDLDTPSPAHGTTQVISQGMTARPALKTTWRVVKRTIPIRADARPSDRLEGSAGFLLADKQALFVTDQDTKLRYRLGAGEALFVPIGANQTWASLGDTAATAYTLELGVRDNVDEAGSGKVIFKGSTFGMAEGDYDLDLLRNVLPKNETTEIDKSAFPIMIFVTSGEVEVKSDKKGVDTKRIKAGSASSFDGKLTIKTRSNGNATFVAAVVSASIGGGRTSANPTAEPTSTPKPTQEPTQTPTPEATAKPEKTATATNVPETLTGTAMIRIYVRICPAGMRIETLDASKCTKAKGGWNLWLDSPYGSPLRLRDANRLENDYIRWDNLKAGKYVLLVREMPKGYDQSSLDGYRCCRTSAGYAITLGPGDQVFGTLYFFPPEE